ncbi:MAG: hypothetical protein ABJF60_09400 [Roseobacter sp.]
MHELALAQRISLDKKIITDAGYSVFQPQSIGVVNSLMRETGRKRQSAMLSTSNNDFTTENSVFVFVAMGESMVGGVRSKVIDLQGETFESHQRRTIPEWYETDGDEIEGLAPALNKLITGRHAYVGDLELQGDHRGQPKVSTAMGRLAVALSLMKWPDISGVYCILPDEHRGRAIDYGFCHFTRSAYKWKNPKPPGGRLRDWGVAVSSRDDLIHYLTSANLE